MKALCLLLMGYAGFLGATDRPTSPFNLSYNHAGTASLEQDFSYLLNPATLGFQKKSQSALAYSFKGSHQVIALSFTDLKSVVPLGITYERHWPAHSQESQLNRTFFSLARPINTYLSAGVTVQRESYGDKKDSLWQGHGGFLLRFSRNSALSFTVNQILVYNSNPERVFGFGLYRKFLDILGTRMDISYSQKTSWQARGALETMFKKYFSLKGGGFWNFQTQKAVWSGGLVFYGPFLQLDYGLEKEGDKTQHAFVGRFLF